MDVQESRHATRIASGHGQPPSVAFSFRAFSTTMGVTMRSLAAAFAALCLLASGASAQDGDRSNHNGLYVGATVGYSASTLRTEGPIDWAKQGALGGILAGYGTTLQGGMYLGVEFDGVLKDIKWSASDGSTTVSASNRWVGTGRVRLGQTLGPALLYLTGGAALTEQTIKATGVGEASDLRWGWVGGAGIEVAATRTLSLRLEGLHYDFSDKAFNVGGISERLGAGENVIRAAVTFKVF